MERTRLRSPPPFDIEQFFPSHPVLEMESTLTDVRQVQPSPDTFYRIQNCDYGHYLEFTSTSYGASAQGRILKDSMKQQVNYPSAAAVPI
jgi:hypothetical protein